MSTKYYVSTTTGEVKGPYAPRQIQMLLSAKRITEQSQVSVDQQSWTPITAVEELASLFGDGEDLPAPKGLGGLPRPGGLGDLPRPKGLSLPKPPTLGGMGGIAPPPPTPATPAAASEAEDDFVIESTSIGDNDLFSRAMGGSSGDDLFGAPSGGDPADDLFGAPGMSSMGSAMSHGIGNQMSSADLFSGPSHASDDGDLFGGDPGAMDDNLFGGNPSRGGAADADLFGAPSAPAPPAPSKPASMSRDDDLFGGPAARSQADDLFGGASSARDDDLFGAPSGGSAGGKARSGGDDDLFGAPSGGGGGGDDLFGAPSGGRDDDLFGAPSGGGGGGGDDLFGAPSGGGGNDLFGGGGGDDLFGAPSAPAKPAAPAPPRPAPSAQMSSDELFAAPVGAGTGGDDLFGGGIQMGGADLFGDNTDDDDFLGGAQGFSFLDEKPKTLHDVDEPAAAEDPFAGGFAAPAQPAAPSLGNQPSAPSLGNQPSAPTLGSQPSAPSMGGAQQPGFGAAPTMGGGAPQQPSFGGGAPRTPEGVSRPPTTGSFMPPSTGIPGAQMASTGLPTPAAEAAPTGDADAAAAKKKKLLMIGAPVGLLLVAAIGVGGWFYMESQKPKPEPPKPKVEPTFVLNMDALKTAGRGQLLTLVDQGRAAKKSEPDTPQKLVLAQALAVSYSPDDQLAATLRKEAAALKGDDDLSKLARAAAEAITGKQSDEARGKLEALSGGSGEVAYFAATLAGATDVLYIEANQLKRPPKVEAPPKEEPKEEVKEEPKKRRGKKGKKKEEPKEEPPAEEVKEEPPKVDPVAERIERAEKTLTGAKGASAAIPAYWLGRLHQHFGEEEQALTAYKESAKAAESFTPPRFRMGGLAYRRGDLNAAYDAAQSISKLDSISAKDKASALLLKGRIEHARAEHDQSIKTLQAGVGMDPTNGDLLVALADAFEAAATFQQALEFFSRDKALDKKTPEVLLGIARANVGLKQWANAVAQLEQGEKLHPEDTRFAMESGKLNLARAALYEAKEGFKRVLEKAPEDPIAHAYMAHIAWKSKKDAAAADAEIAKVVAKPDALSAEAARLVADYYMMSGRGTLSRQWYQAALKIDPNVWPVRAELARMALNLEEHDGALVLLEHAKKQGVKDIELSALLADAYRQAKKYDRAVDEINQVLQSKPKEPEYIFIRGRIFFDKGNYPTAREDFNRAYELDTRFHRAYFFVGRTALEEKKLERASKIFRHVLDNEPNNGEVRFFMAQLYELQKDDREALQQYSKILELDQGYVVRNPRVFIKRGLLLSKLGYSDKARKDIRRAVEIAPDMLDAQLAMGDVYFQDQRYGEAVEILERALEKAPKNADIHYKLGMSNIYLGDRNPKKRADAAIHLQQALRYGYENPDIYRTLGYLYKQQREKDKALEAFKTFWKKTTDDASISQGTKLEVLRQIKELGG